VVDAFNLTPNEGWLYTVIVKFANRKTGDAFPSQAKLAKVANMSKSSVIRCIAALEKKNLIKVERDVVKGKKQKAVNHYVVLDPYQVAEGSVTQTPRSFPQTLPVVSEVDSNNNQLINTKEQQQPPAESDRPTPPPKPVVVVGSEDSQDWLDKHVEKAAPLRSRRTDADYGRVCVAYENNIGAITQHIGETLSHACDEYPPEWIVEAINESAERNVRNWKYIDAILKNWNVTGRGAPKPGAKPSGSPLGPADPDCPMCEGKGVYSYDVPYGDPRFGKTEVCACRKPGTQEAAA